MTTTSKAKRRLSSMEGTVTNLGYDSYATAWRYLGVYNDCGGSDGSYWSSWWSRGRRLSDDGSGSNDGGGSNDGEDADDDGEAETAASCGGTRKLLWAAYHDPDYAGSEIGDYAFYADGEWDNATCVGESCGRMDCHDPYNSTWELLGVYKETVDFDNDNFFEQLFKHQGYCLWDGDKEDSDGQEDGSDSSSSDSQDYSGWESSSYQFMQAMRNELPSGCIQVGDLNYGYEDAYYIAIKPLPEGNMTLGVYTDSSCAEEADFSFSDYQNYAASSLTATAASGAFDAWNGHMDAYKVCQPCRAYNRQATSEGRRRRLKEEDDGQGDEEQNGYNCYDDAGYQNCNQCYKFETHTDMEAAGADDLAAASAQGTLLALEYGGVWYGNGTVGDVVPQNSSSTQSAASYQSVAQNSSGYQSAWSSRSAPSDGARPWTSHAAAGGASLVICAIALGLRKATRRRIALDAGEGTAPTTTSPPLV